MGDRAFLEITVRKSDGPLIEKELGTFEEIFSEEETWITAGWHQMSGGACEHLKGLAIRNPELAFYGYQESCIGIWDPIAFAAIGGQYDEAPYAPNAGCLVVYADKDGRIDEKQAVNVREFAEFRAKAREAVGGGP